MLTLTLKNMHDAVTVIFNSSKSNLAFDESIEQ